MPPSVVHLVFELLACFAGGRLFFFLRRREGDRISSDSRVWVVIGAALGALLGSRLLAAFEDPALWWLHRSDWLYYFANKTIIGGLLGGLIGVELIKKAVGERQSSGDLFVFPLMLAIGIGRIGCFLAGLADNTYGAPTDGWWGIDLGDGIPRHPVQLFEVAFLGAWALFLQRVRGRYDLRNGALFRLFMSGYLAWRFLLDFLRPVYLLPFTGLSVIQMACLAGLLYYYKVWLQPRSLLDEKGANQIFRNRA